MDVIHKMGFFRDLNDRVYNHRSDRRDAPVEPPAEAFVNPPAPQPSTFQSESSSSALKSDDYGRVVLALRLHLNQDGCP
ncbi:hypothetical protein Lal_00027156 [Lupinus albus]|nr:hypothetical protein Lal_00027156 [Lupinus albus]